MKNSKLYFGLMLLEKMQNDKDNENWNDKERYQFHLTGEI